MQIPGYLLPHRATINGVEEVPCFIQQTLGGIDTEAGKVYYAQVKLFLAPDADCPAGCPILLPDGRAGYAGAVALMDGGNMPTPNHLQVAVAIGQAIGGAPAGVTVTLLIRTLAADKDPYGNDRYTTAEVDVPKCSVTQLNSTEKTDLRDEVTTTLEVILPPGSPVPKAIDRVRVAGDVYDIVGRPKPLLDNMTGTDAGTRVVAQRVTG